MNSDRTGTEGGNGSGTIKLLSTYKTVACSEPGCNPQLCMNYHQDSERRRNPYYQYTFLYSPEWCKDVCRGDDCRWCLTQNEFDFHPLNYKADKCAQYKNCTKTFCHRYHEHDHPIQGGSFYKFDLYTFKTQPCQLNYHHDLKICLFFHNLDDRRRPDLNYQHVICQFYKNCSMGDGCPYSHNKIQQLYHPSRYKSKFCQKYPKNIPSCKYQDFCSFAHTIKEITIDLIHLRPQDKSFFINEYKTIWCPFTRDHQRNKCVYAHNIQDFRRNPNEYKYNPQNCPFWKTAENIKSIEQAGCKNMMNCTKCHGRKELEYHPLAYKSKNEKNSKFSNFNRQRISQKLETSSKEEFVERKKTDMVAPSQVIMSMIGAPFFQNDTKSISSKTTRAKSGGTCRHTDFDREKKRKESVDSCSSKLEFSCKDSYHCIYGSDECQKQFFQLFDRPQRLEFLPEKKPERARSQNQKTKDFRLYYSQEITDIFQDTNVLEKLAYRKITQVKVLNMEDKEIMQICWLSSSQKHILLEGLRKLERRSVHYSLQLHQHFRKHNKIHILETLRCKRVKEKKLLTMQAEEVQLLSFMEEEDKKLLPIIIKDFVDNQEFFDLRARIDREVSDTHIFQ